MNKAELIRKMAAKLDIPQYKTRRFLTAFEEVLTETIKQDVPIMLQGFGTFTPWQQGEREARNPRTGVPCTIPSRKSLKFKPGKFLLEDLNEG